jgi:hypothetical protein
MTNIKIILRSIEQVKYFLSEQNKKYSKFFPKTLPQTLNFEKQLQELSKDLKTQTVYFLAVNETKLIPGSDLPMPENNITFIFVKVIVSKNNNKISLYEDVEIMMKG